MGKLCRRTEPCRRVDGAERGGDAGHETAKRYRVISFHPSKNAVSPIPRVQHSSTVYSVCALNSRFVSGSQEQIQSWRTTMNRRLCLCLLALSLLLASGIAARAQGAQATAPATHKLPEIKYVKYA